MTTRLVEDFAGLCDLLNLATYAVFKCCSSLGTRLLPKIFAFEEALEELPPAIQDDILISQKGLLISRVLWSFSFLMGAQH